MSLEQIEGAIADADRAATLSIGVAGVETAEDQLREELPEKLEGVLVSGGEAAAQTRQPDGAELTFEPGDPAVERWALARAADVVEDFGAKSREAVGFLVDWVFTFALPPLSAALLIKGLVGLTKPQAEAALNLEGEVLAAEAGSVVERAGGRFSVEIPASGASEEFAREQVFEYAVEMRDVRADLAARTEAIEAANEGQRQAWLQAVESGLLDGERKREVIVTPDDRLDELICKPMSGQQRGLTEPFETPDGELFMNPPFHPGCRLWSGLGAHGASRCRIGFNVLSNWSLVVPRSRRLSSRAASTSWSLSSL